jgi:hypothetical protein
VSTIYFRKAEGRRLPCPLQAFLQVAYALEDDAVFPRIDAERVKVALEIFYLLAFPPVDVMLLDCHDISSGAMIACI